MNYSIGIWAHAQVPHGVVYRWEADGGQHGTGFVILDTSTPEVRPCDGNGDTVGGLVLDADSGSVGGNAVGVDRTTFSRTAAAILKSFFKTGQAPETAHTYFG